MDVPDVLFRVLISAKKAAWIPFKQEAVCPHRWPDGIWKDAPLFGDPRSHFQYEKPKTANREHAFPQVGIKPFGCRNVRSILDRSINRTRQAKFQLASTELSSSTISADHGSVDESFFLYSRYPPSKRSIDEIRACFERVTEMILQDVLTPEGSIPAITFGQITNEDKDTLSHKHLFAWIWKK
ncbi:hypothetical protein DI09_15p120 [Mitosporidium daphniae]|uniref:Uncharacterized protein n=1 Tax=Mitosporidium daphniae TaxID=1485682 RepID=A0A098VUB1_9MICR|nr:uncharacterized protein DI09_15p120 [Mitosporidium daphniae]KGG52545.1 hypothetical protein DI09_15p120 [Mitosporidium daphniae]|eukprot:XP_013238972.1 uncharacterized protein DI09_15p120 [Mitosporidium daphniae]